MPLTYSIANGIFLSVIAYSVLQIMTGKAKETHIAMHIPAALFVLKFIFIGAA